MRISHLLTDFFLLKENPKPFGGFGLYFMIYLMCTERDYNPFVQKSSSALRFAMYSS